MKKFEMCQRPERAYFISTEEKNMSTLYTMGVNALNGLTSFLPKSLDALTPAIARCQRPERAYFISTPTKDEWDDCKKERGVNALNGLTSFLRYPLKPLENTGFPASFLQVFVRLF